MDNDGGQAAGERRTAITINAAAGALLLLLALLLYLLTLDNGLAPGELVGGDLITHQYAQVQARPSNAPGYPLYTMGGWAWFHGWRGLIALLGDALPNPIPILSSYSTLWALPALLLLYALVLRLTRSPARPRGNWPLAFLLSAFYAVTYFFWYYATTTEQYTSAIAQTLAIVYVYVLWDEGQRPMNGDDARSPAHPLTRSSLRGDRLLVFLAFLCGLSLAHMLTVAFLVPPVVLAVLWRQPRLLRNWRMILLCVLAALLPLASYWYVWVRGAAHPEWWGAGEWRSAGEWFWAFVSTAQGREELSWGFRSGCALFDNGFPELIWRELSLPILLVGLGGIALLRRPLSLVLYATLAIYLVFDWMYRCANWYQVILPAYPLLLLGVAAAADQSERWLRRWSNKFNNTRHPRHPRHRVSLRNSVSELNLLSLVAYAPLLLLALAVVWRLGASWEAADSRNRPGDIALTRAAVLLDQPLPTDAGLFAAVEDALALDYLVEIWGIRPDLAVVSSETAGERLGAGGTVLSTYDAAPVLLSELPADLAVRRAGAGADWLRLSAAPAPVEPPAHALEQELVPGVILKGYTVAPAPTGAPVIGEQGAAQQAVDVTLAWGLLGEWPDTLGISLRPTQGGAFIPLPGGEAGAILQVDAPAPLHGLAPPGDSLLADTYRVPFPAGADGLLLIVYTREGEGFRNLLELPLTAD